MGEVWKRVWSECGGVEKCVGMWKETRKDMGRGVEKCVGVWETL